MRRIAGILISALGILFLMKPDFNLLESIEVLIYLIYTYWPLFLICFGIFLHSTSLPKKRTK